jgi:DNA (cytosine-5)-methyltransferase 3A
MGDVKDLTAGVLPKIDLLIGGSPCQDLSFAGKGKGLEGDRSSLFYQYVRLLKECKPKYFLLENVRMKQEYQDIISDLLGVQPIKINSSLVSAQNRVRLYWTNIPGILQPEDKGILLKDILESNPDQSFNSGHQKSGGKHSNMLNTNYKSQANTIHDVNKKSPTVCAGTHGYALGHVERPCEPKVNTSETTYRKLTLLECERLQTIPDGYTSGVSNSQRYRMLGNSFTADVIAHLFKGLKDGE